MKRLRETVGFRIKILRSEKEITQNDLAKYLSVTRMVVTNWETNRTFPDPQSLMMMADYFGVSVDYLLCRTNIRPPAHLVTNIVDFLDGLTDREKNSVIDFISYLRDRKNQ
jgi:Predicted transcriptional regulators